MEVVFNRGIYLPDLDLWLDSRRSRDLGLVSHAHTDHLARHRRPVLTPNTGALLQDYFSKSSPICLEYGEALENETYTLTLHPAGHCLGSAQVLIQSKHTGVKVLYTGDFKPRPSPTNEPLEPVPCDILVMEATYGKAHYRFPPQEQVLQTAFQTIRNWLSKGERPVILGWRLGKAQELLHHLLGQGFEVLVEESIYQLARIYQEAGVVFPGELKAFDGQPQDGQVVLCPPGTKANSALKGLRGLRFMELTGWAADGQKRWGRPADASLPFSDHPDFRELTDYVLQVQPKQVYTVNGFPDLAAHLREIGYPAVHLDGRGRFADDGFQMKML